MNKRVIGIFAALAALALIAVVLGVVFVIGDVEVQPDVSFALSAEESAKIVNDSKIVVRGSIFSLDEQIAKDNVERNNPTIKVTDIVRKAPNKVCINVTRRVAVYAAATADGKYATIDGDLKIVEVIDTLRDDAFLCVIGGLTLADPHSGETLEGYDFLKDVYRAARGMSFKDKRFGTFFPTVRKDGGQAMLTTNTGVTLCVYIGQDVEPMMRGAYNAYLSSEPKRYFGYWRYTDAGWRHFDALSA